MKIVTNILDLMKHLVGSRVQMIASGKHTGHSLGTKMVIEAMRLSKYLVLVPSVFVRQHIAKREKANMAFLIYHSYKLLLLLLSC